MNKTAEDFAKEIRCALARHNDPKKPVFDLVDGLVCRLSEVALSHQALEAQLAEARELLEGADVLMTANCPIPEWHERRDALLQDIERNI